MKISTIGDMTILEAEDGMALCRVDEEWPTTSVRVSLGRNDAPSNWKDCEYGEPQPEETPQI